MLRRQRSLFSELTGDNSFRRFLSTAELVAGLNNKSLDDRAT